MSKKSKKNTQEPSPKINEPRALSKYAKKKAAQAEEERLALLKEQKELAAKAQDKKSKSKLSSENNKKAPIKRKSAVKVVVKKSKSKLSANNEQASDNNTTTATKLNEKRKLTLHKQNLKRKKAQAQAVVNRATANLESNTTTPANNASTIKLSTSNHHKKSERRAIRGGGMFGFGELELADNDDTEVKDLLAEYSKKELSQQAKKSRAKLLKHQQEVRLARQEAKAQRAIQIAKGEVKTVYNRWRKQVKYIPLPGVVNTLGIETKEKVANLNDPEEKQALNRNHNRRDQFLFAPIKRVNKPIIGVDKIGNFFDDWAKLNDPNHIFSDLIKHAKEVRKSENGMAYIGLAAFFKFLEGKPKRIIIDEYAFEFKRFIKRREVTDFIATMKEPALSWFQSRHPLDESYALLYIDTYPIRLKLGKKKIYVGHHLFLSAITLDGRKDLLGIIPDYNVSRASVKFWDTIFSEFKNLGLKNLCFIIAGFKCRYIERALKVHFPQASLHFNLLEVLQFDSYDIDEHLRKSFMQDVKLLLQEEKYEDAYNALKNLRDKWDNLKKNNTSILQGNVELLEHVCALDLKERKLLSTNKMIADIATTLLGNKQEQDFFSDHSEMLTYLFYRYILFAKMYWFNHQDQAIYNLTFSKLFSKLRQTPFSGGKLLDELLKERHQDFMLRHFGHFGNGPVFNLNPSSSRKKISLSGQLHANLSAEKWVDNNNNEVNLTPNDINQEENTNNIIELSPIDESQEQATLELTPLNQDNDKNHIEHDFIFNSSHETSSLTLSPNPQFTLVDNFKEYKKKDDSSLNKNFNRSKLSLALDLHNSSHNAMTWYSNNYTEQTLSSYFERNLIALDSDELLNYLGDHLLLNQEHHPSLKKEKELEEQNNESFDLSSLRPFAKHQKIKEDEKALSNRFSMRKRYCKFEYKVDIGFANPNYDVERIDGLDGYNEIKYNKNNAQSIMDINLDHIASNIAASNTVFGMLRPSINQALKNERQALYQQEINTIHECLGYDFNFDNIDNVIHQITPIFKSALQNKLDWYANQELEKKKELKAKEKLKSHQRYLKRLAQRALQKEIELSNRPIFDVKNYNIHQHESIELKSLLNSTPNFNVQNNVSFTQEDIKTVSFKHKEQESKILSLAHEQEDHTLNLINTPNFELNLKGTDNLLYHAQDTNLMHIVDKQNELNLEKAKDFKGPIPAPEVRHALVKSLVDVAGVKSSHIDNDITLELIGQDKEHNQ